MNTNWHGLLKIFNIQLISNAGDILWEENNLLNTLHVGGEDFILRAAFSDTYTDGGGNIVSTIIPPNFYFGLDNRSSLTTAHTMSSIIGEPSINGYARQSVSSNQQFIVELLNSVYVAKAPIVIFTANGGSWGPVQNLFLTNASDNSGYLIASVPLTTAITVQADSTLNVRMGLGLKDCP